MFTLDDLVGNGTVSTTGADILRGIGTGVESFLVYALPRNAGKSTVTHAVLAEAPPDVPRHDFLGTEQERDTLTGQPASGYLVVAEMGHRGRPGYLAGEEITRAFELVEHGFALATSLHADSVEQVFDVLAQNGVSTASALAVRYLIKVAALGDPFDDATRRIVEQVHEVTGTADTGAVISSLLYETLK